MKADLDTSEEIMNFLEANRFATIATISSEKQIPQAAFVYYTCFDSIGGILFFTTTKGSKKIKNLENNNAIAVVITDTVEKKTLQLEGKGNTVADEDKALEIITRIYKKIHEDNAEVNWPLLKLKPHDLEVVQVTIDWFRYSSFGRETNVAEGKYDDLVE